jgi:hypothetical protein
MTKAPRRKFVFTPKELDALVRETYDRMRIMSRVIIDLQERYATDAVTPGRSPVCKCCANRAKGNGGHWICCIKNPRPVLSLKGCDSYFGHREIMAKAKTCRKKSLSQEISARVVKQHGRVRGTMILVESLTPLDTAEVATVLQTHFKSALPLEKKRSNVEG